MEKKRYPIISKEYIDKDVVSMQIKAADIADTALPGQFISIYTDDKSLLLPRPISICDTDKACGTVRIVFRVVGKGTAEFAAKDAGDELDIIGPLGNGYVKALEWLADNASANEEPENIILIGGGIGIPPMLMLAKALACNADNNLNSSDRVSVVLGYRDSLFMNKDFEQYAGVFISTEDGSSGTCGNVIDCIRENDLSADVIMACGPLPMLKGIKAYAEQHNIKAWVSLEERMACGIGACLACVCKTDDIDGHSMVKNKRICKDGPVFDVKEVDFS